MTNVEGLPSKSDVSRIFAELSSFKNMSWERRENGIHRGNKNSLSRRFRVSLRRSQFVIPPFHRKESNTKLWFHCICKCFLQTIFPAVSCLLTWASFRKGSWLCWRKLMLDDKTVLGRLWPRDSLSERNTLVPVHLAPKARGRCADKSSISNSVGQSEAKFSAQCPYWWEVRKWGIILKSRRSLNHTSHRRTCAHIRAPC